MSTRILAFWAVVVFSAHPAFLQAQTPPRIMIGFDTSGSMAMDLAGTPTYGDGVLDGCTTMPQGHFCGTDCMAGIDTDCDGEANDSRVYVAGEALRNMILSTGGDVDWALSRFQQTPASRTICNVERVGAGLFGIGGVQDVECTNSLSSFGNPQCNANQPTITTCGGGLVSVFDFPTAPVNCRPNSGGNPPFRQLDYVGAADDPDSNPLTNPQVCLNYVPAVCDGTANSGDILVGFSDLGPFSGQSNVPGMLRWVDHTESNFNTSVVSANHCNHAGAGNCELRPIGPTPLAGILRAAESYMVGVRNNDPRRACRPYSIILLTDGDETCSGNPAAAAMDLFTLNNIETYVVGMSVSSNPVAVATLNAIAAAGNTGTAFFADNQVTLAAALSTIVANSIQIETCNMLDDDCDTFIDEGVLNACGGCGAVPTEVCNMMDDDCDMNTDEGVANACGGCGAAPTEICDRLDNDCDGIIDEDGMGGDICAGCSPAAEICDGMDNDCDMTVDEDVTRGCGTDVGECVAGTETCIIAGTGMFGPCVGETPPTMEICDNLDNDCDGAIDGFSEPCGTSVGICVPGNRVCIAGVPGACIGSIPPGTEVCNGLDDDCMGDIDEGNPGGGMQCGTNAGICDFGTTACSGGMLMCMGGTPPLPAELCNTFDDDCDGVSDEGNPGGGASCGMTDVGECELGAEACVLGAIVCLGETGPSPELCDGLDNDCMGDIDEGDPEAGAMCGDDTGECMSGTFACVSGALICMGGVGPMMETCNGLDDDCDGTIDDGIPIGAPCGSDIGECVPGVNVCSGGALVCQGETGVETEICDALDNDCDGSVDEGVGLGGPCGSSMGLCMPGTELCSAGRLICSGERGPQRETCDCSDNDCDGTTDEAPDTGVLCPPGSECVDCQCALPCMTGEFGFTCPTGKTPSVDGTECFCVADLCDSADCATETVDLGGETRCEPDSADVANCVCLNNTCTFSCDGIVCMGGTVCNPRDPLGLCVENNCRGLGCSTGEICDVPTGICGADPCEGVDCGVGEACRDGACEGSCAGVMCVAGELCSAGACAADPCDGVSCASGEVCDPTGGSCVADLCATVSCPVGQVCELSSGNCVADPCAALRCPDGEMCTDGECTMSTTGTDAGPDAGGMDGGTSEDTRDRVLAAGGCFCRATAAPSSGDSAPWFFVVALLGFLWRRRRSRSGGRARRGLPFERASSAAIVVLAMLTGGCDVDPFCLDCDDEASDAGDGDVSADSGGGDAGPADSGGGDAGSDDGGSGDACVPEACNGVDDDCDGNVDEEFDTSTDIDHCGACGDICAPIGAFPVCTAGSCMIESCDVGRHDIDGDPANGCEYRCLQESPDDAVCDRRDNDCDTLLDEDVDTDTDVNNCGSCAFVCSFPNAASTCVGGTCTLGACATNFYDIDLDPANGCEYSCAVATPAVETCNARDDDCDGTIDEGNPDSGAACGISTGECTTGTEQCVGGSLVCMGAVVPTTEICDGLDNDCMGDIDEGDPDSGRVCGTSDGICVAGRETCMGGGLVCVGEVMGLPAELCNNLDDDCDGMTDEMNPGGGGTCGVDTGECAFGTLTCSGGVLQCLGGTGPTLEICNGLDDDCSGMPDDIFDFANDPNNCGSCGNFCSFPNATAGCSAMTCVILACDPGFVNADMSPTDPDGCEYACSFAGAEICNGNDDDCDLTTDEDITVPTNFCLPNGVCAATPNPTCMGSSGWVCEYDPIEYEVVETQCDTLDNDCDGAVDEPFAGIGTACSNGTGICQTNGMIECTVDEMGTQCSAPPAGSPAPNELCNDRDDDCDTRIDEEIEDFIDAVDIGGGRLVMRFEASRPDADATGPGNVLTHACSTPNVIPWTQVTWTQARDACCAINDSGTCSGGAGEWRLCDHVDWELACEGPGGTPCEWSYDASCTTSATLTCNGDEFDSDIVMPGDQDSIFPTGSTTFGTCDTNWGGAGVIYDLSGNAKEWTNEQPAPGLFEIRGGSYNNIEQGRTCEFDFTVGDLNFAFPNTGFRCCRY